jgi:hypothetical protein
MVAEYGKEFRKKKKMKHHKITLIHYFTGACSQNKHISLPVLFIHSFHF